MGRRAESLADRIEEGAADLSAFAEGLSEAEWHAPLSRNGGDRRSIGVIVNHVASVYPAQFVIEDHALRHCWHHLARIRTALGR